MSVSYIDYKKLKEFYIVDELVDLLKLDKTTLRVKCEQYGIKPRRNEIGDWGLVKYDVRKLHNSLYHEDRPNGKKAEDDDPWR